MLKHFAFAANEISVTMTSRPVSEATGASSSLSDRTYTEVGPITRHELAASYLRQHKIPQMFESIVAGLMIERPEDPFQYMDKRLDQIKEKGVHFVNWETFVHHLHPRRDPAHLKLVHDPQYDKTVKPEKEDKMGTEQGLERENTFYKPDVFRLTEPAADE